MSEEKTIRELQMAVVEAAIAWHAAPGIDEYLDHAVGVLLAATKTTATEPADLVWVQRTMKDVRAGDYIRQVEWNGSGESPVTHVTNRYLPPMKDGSNAGNWHMVPGESSHWDDRVVKPGEVWLCLDGGKPRNLDPDFPVEIQLPSPRFLQLGDWGDRMDVKAS